MISLFELIIKIEPLALQFFYHTFSAAGKIKIQSLSKILSSECVCPYLNLKGGNPFLM